MIVISIVKMSVLYDAVNYAELSAQTVYKITVHIRPVRVAVTRTLAVSVHGSEIRYSKSLKFP